MAITAHRPTVRHKTSWRKLRVYSYNAELGVQTSRVYGYRAECDCGAPFKVQRTVALARLDIRDHRAQAPAG